MICEIEVIRTTVLSYTEGATENLFDDMIKDVAESTSKTKVQNKIESRVSDVISRNSTQHDEPKIVHLLSGPIILGIMKYNKLCKTGNISPPDSDRVRRTLQVRYLHFI